MIEGRIQGRRFSLDFSGDRLKADFEDQEDKKFMLEYETYGYHPDKGPGMYKLKENLESAQACIDSLIGAGLDITVTKGATEYSEVKFE